MKTLLSSLLLCGALLAPSAVCAEPAQPLDPVITTATRTPTPLDQTIGSARVITREAIERLQARDLIDVLRAQPGLTVAQTGGRGQQTSVFIRGNENRQTLVLINGRRAGTVELPGFSWEYLPLDDIEQIEFVPGARSSLYGSQAFGGVINIITRKDSDTTLRAGGGNLGAFDVSGHTGWNNEKVDLGLNAGLERSSGFDVTTPANFGHDDDRDGFDSHHVGLHAGINFGSLLRMDLDSLHNQGLTEFDSTTNDFRLDQHRLGFGFKLGERSSLQLDAGYNRDQRSYDFSGFSAYNDSQRRSASAQFTQGFIGGSSVIGGFDFTQDRYSTGGSQTQRLARAVFANIAPKLGAFNLEAGARYERDDAYGNITTGQLGLRYALNQQASVFARGGTAFRAPTFEERFGGAFNIANPNLDPERGHSAEIGTSLTVAGITADLSVYQNRVRDLINYTTVDPNGIPFDGDEISSYQNVARTRLQGAELQLKARWFETDLSTGLSYLDARDQTTGATLARRPHQSTRLDADRRCGSLGYGLTVIGEGSRPDAGTTVGGFGLLNLRASWTPMPSLTWELAGFNVLDRDYTTVATYRSESATVRLGFVWRPGA